MSHLQRVCLQLHVLILGAYLSSRRFQIRIHMFNIETKLNILWRHKCFQHWQKHLCNQYSYQDTLNKVIHIWFLYSVYQTRDWWCYSCIWWWQTNLSSRMYTQILQIWMWMNNLLSLPFSYLYLSIFIFIFTHQIVFPY